MEQPHGLVMRRLASPIVMSAIQLWIVGLFEHLESKEALHVAYRHTATLDSKWQCGHATQGFVGVSLSFSLRMDLGLVLLMAVTVMWRR